MKSNIFISATDNFTEHFAVNMFRSFIKHNPCVSMYCVVRDVSLSVQNTLSLLGVNLIQYEEPDSFDIRNFSIIIAPYLRQIPYKNAMWMDIDALIFDDIRHLFLHKEEFVAIPQNLGSIWQYLNRENRPAFAMGTWVATREMAEIMNELYRKSDMKQSEGEFLKSHAEKFHIRVLDGEPYTCGRDMTDRLKIENGRPYHMRYGRKLFPKFVHFSVCTNQMRPFNYEVITTIA